MGETVDVVGKLYDSGREPGSYCFSLTVDGDERPVLSSNCASAEAAMAHGRAKLEEAVAAENPESAYCVVYASQEIDAEPLGVWDYSKAQRQLHWTPDE